MNDLELVETLVQNKAFNPDIANSALQKFKGHLWFLFPELMPLAFNSNKVNSNLKGKVVFLIFPIIPIVPGFYRGNAQNQARILSHGEGQSRQFGRQNGQN
jgi:hypothetical protein